MKILLLFALALTAQQAHYRHIKPNVPLNDTTATPGDVDPALTAAKLCDPKFRTATVRNVTEATKKAVCRAYGIAVGCPGSGYEIDHLISLEVGGSDATSNLWPQPVDTKGTVGFHTKDVVENRSHAAVCSGKITLMQAQHGLSTDWYSFGVSQGFLTAEGATK